MKRTLTRRDFIKGTGAIATGILASPSMPIAEANDDLPVHFRYIDAHVHVWSGDTDRYPLAEGQNKENMNPPSFTPAELFDHMWGAGVGRVNLIQMSYYGADNTYMLEMMAKYPGTFAGTAIVDPLGDDPGGAMVRLAERKCYSFRIQPAMVKETPERWLQHPSMEAMFATASKHDLALCPLIRVDALPALDRMCTKYPDALVAIDHLCLVDTEQAFEHDLAALTAMAKHKRVHVKVGAFYALGKRTPPYLDLLPAIQRVVEAFGPERCMWESDAPFQMTNHRYEDSIALLRDRATFLTEEDKAAILGGTAEKLFFRDIA